MGPDYRACPFHGRPCVPKCAIYVESENGTDGRCGLIHTQPGGSTNGNKSRFGGEKEDLSDDERLL